MTTINPNDQERIRILRRSLDHANNRLADESKLTNFYIHLSAALFVVVIFLVLALAWVRFGG